MLRRNRRENSRGASVLAALVLVGILSVVYTAFQYAHSSGRLGYEPQSMVASAPPLPHPVSTPKAPILKGCKPKMIYSGAELVQDGDKQTCSCDQKQSVGTDATENVCLPG